CASCTRPAKISLFLYSRWTIITFQANSVAKIDSSTAKKAPSDKGDNPRFPCLPDLPYCCPVSRLEQIISVKGIKASTPKVSPAHHAIQFERILVCCNSSKE